MPEPVVEALFAAPPRAVLAALSGRIKAEGWTLTGVGDFGALVTWHAFNAQVDLVGLRAEIDPHPEQEGVTVLRIVRVDPALDAALLLTRVPRQRERRTG